MATAALNKEIMKYLSSLGKNQQERVLSFLKSLMQEKNLLLHTCFYLPDQSHPGIYNKWKKPLIRAANILTNMSGKFALDTNIVIGIFASDSSNPPKVKI